MTLHVLDLSWSWEDMPLATHHPLLPTHIRFEALI